MYIFNLFAMNVEYQLLVEVYIPTYFCFIFNILKINMSIIDRRNFP